MKGEALLPHQVMVLEEAGTVRTVAGLKLHLVSHIQLLRVRINGRKAVMTVRKGLRIMAWGMMQ